MIAPNRNRTYDLSLTKGMPYHWATGAKFWFYRV